MTPHLVTIGDSVHWGQGLQREHKLHAQVARALRAAAPDLVDVHMAHSGAIIGAGATVTRQRVDGEVPVGSPTILEQAAAFPGDPMDVTAILVNGGINDVDIRTILNPFVPSAVLRDLTREHCFDSMRVLLEDIAARFPSPATRVVVTGYYPVLSERSQSFGIPLLLEHHGLFLPGGAAVGGANPVVQHCLQFWRDSTTDLQDAVATVRASHPRRQIVFVDPGFGERHAVFADDPWLFGLTPLLMPEDEVVQPRHAACNIALPPLDVLAREQCYRASAGHPNTTGARRYAEGVAAALGLTMP